MKVVSKILAVVRQFVSRLIKDWKEVVARGVPAVFLVLFLAGALMDLAGINLSTFPAFITELYFMRDSPGYMSAICFTIAIAGFMLPCMEIVMQNKTNVEPWVIIVVVSADVIGLINSLWIDIIPIPRQRILVLILMELLLVASQIINVKQKKKQNASRHDELN